MRIFKWVAVFLIVMLAAAQAQAKEEIVARVGPGWVSQAEYRIYLEHYAGQQGLVPEALTREEKRKALDLAIDDEMLFQEALSEKVPEQKEIREALVADYRARHAGSGKTPGDDEKNFKGAMAEGLHRSFAARQRIINTFLVREGTTREIVLPILHGYYSVKILREDLEAP